MASDPSSSRDVGNRRSTPSTSTITAPMVGPPALLSSPEEILRSAVATAGIIGNALGGWLLELHVFFVLQSWQWMFIMEAPHGGPLPGRGGPAPRPHRATARGPDLAGADSRRVRRRGGLSRAHRSVPG